MHHTSPYQYKNDQSILVADKKERDLDDVLDELNSENEREFDENRVVRRLEEVFGFMEKNEWIDTKVPSKVKVRVLKCLYRFVECQSQQVLINIAKVILAVRSVYNGMFFYSIAKGLGFM